MFATASVRISCLYYCCSSKINGLKMYYLIPSHRHTPSLF